MDENEMSQQELMEEAKKNRKIRKVSSQYEKIKQVLNNPKMSPVDIKVPPMKGLKILNQFYSVKILESLDSMIKSKLKRNSKKRNLKQVLKGGTKRLKIHQIVPVLAPRDAVGNEVLAIRDALQELGYDSEIYVETIHPEMSKECKNYFSNGKNLESDLLIYHHAIGSKLADAVLNSSSKLVVIYHNITPEKYFVGVNDDITKTIRAGIEQIKTLKDRTTLAISHSQFSTKELQKEGYSKIITIPFLIDFKIYKEPLNDKLIKKFEKSFNILFVGRVVPHKKIENLLKVFAYYNSCINPNSNLFIIGNHTGTERYYYWLRDMITQTRLSNVHFVTKSSNKELASYYNLADIFLSMSMHEGFGVPLVESMHFRVPIIAYNSTAIPETLGDSGILIEKEDPEDVAELIDIIRNNQKLREKIIEKQESRLKAFDFENTKKELVRNLQMLVRI